MSKGLRADEEFLREYAAKRTRVELARERFHERNLGVEVVADVLLRAGHQSFARLGFTWSDEVNCWAMASSRTMSPYSRWRTAP